MATENQKIPCGGFRIGDGLAMDGDTLKSLGGAYVKIVQTGMSSGKPVFEYASDSPIQSYEQLMLALNKENVVCLNKNVFHYFITMGADEHGDPVYPTFQCLTIPSSGIIQGIEIIFKPFAIEYNLYKFSSST